VLLECELYILKSELGSNFVERRLHNTHIQLNREFGVPQGL